MKIVSKESWETVTVYTKTMLYSAKYGVNMQTGAMHNFSPLVKVLPIPNTELHLNK